MPKNQSFSRILGYRCYLAGPIDRCPDNGRTWRKNITGPLRSRGLVVLDPLEKPIDIGGESPEERKARARLKELYDFDTFSEEMKLIAAIDLRMVNTCDFVIARVDPSIHMCGTYDEIVRANDQKKPVIIFCEQGRRSIPDWLFGKLPHDLFFESIDDVLAYLDHVAYDEHVRHYKRWLFLDPLRLYTPEVIEAISRIRESV